MNGVQISCLTVLFHRSQNETARHTSSVIKKRRQKEHESKIRINIVVVFHRANEA